MQTIIFSDDESLLVINAFLGAIDGLETRTRDAIVNTLMGGDHNWLARIELILSIASERVASLYDLAEQAGRGAGLGTTVHQARRGILSMANRAINENGGPSNDAERAFVEYFANTKAR